jgi:hypothetical protein
MSFVSLQDQIALDHVECLNLDSVSQVRALFANDQQQGIKSDIDPQLLISIPFQNSVRLGGIKVTFGDDFESRPNGIKLFINRVSMGFSDAESLAPIQTVSYEELKSGETVPLKIALFQNVVSVQIFVEDNNGGERTEIRSLELFGTLGEQMNMRDFKKIKEDD